MDQWLATFTEHPWEPQLVVLLSTAYAMLLGGIVGFERELKNRPAGFRTHMLVAGASALLVGLGDLIANHFTAQHSEQILRIDPIRLIEAVVTAVGFLGAGASFRRAGGNRDHARRAGHPGLGRAPRGHPRRQAPRRVNPRVSGLRGSTHANRRRPATTPAGVARVPGRAAIQGSN